MSLFVKVGNFAKSTGAATASQPINGVGFQPKCLILWTSGGVVDGTIRTQAGGDCRSFIGIVTGTAAGEHYAAAATAVAAAGGGRRHAQKACLLVAGTGTVSSEAVLSSFDSDGFTLSWTTNNVAEAQVIHYIALGGSDVQAKVLNFATTGTTSDTAATGAGFKPNLVLLPASLTSQALNSAQTQHSLRFGAGTGPAARWSISRSTTQALSAQAWRWHRNDRLIANVATAGASNSVFDLVSMDADGFTIHPDDATAQSAVHQVGALCLKVPSVTVGTFLKPTSGAPAAHTVSLGYAPSLVLLASDQDINRANAFSQTGSRGGLSAFTAAGAEASVHSIPDVANPIAFAALEKSSKAAVKIDNATPALDAEATGTLGGGDFTLTWNANDAVATEFGYIAIGVAPLPKGMGRVTKRRHYIDRARLPRGAFRRRTN